MLEIRELATQIKSKQIGLFETTLNLEKDETYLQKMLVKEMELRKGNERLDEIYKQLSETLREEQEGYNRTIGHMRQSIQQDEKAIEGLVKQATLIEHMIN